MARNLLLSSILSGLTTPNTNRSFHCLYSFWLAATANFSPLSTATSLRLSSHSMSSCLLSTMEDANLITPVPMGRSVFEFVSSPWVEIGLGFGVLILFSYRWNIVLLCADISFALFTHRFSPSRTYSKRYFRCLHRRLGYDPQHLHPRLC